MLQEGCGEFKEGFTRLVRELQAEFRFRGWFLSAALPHSPAIICRGVFLKQVLK
jgi:hypothetical protein